MGREVLLGQAPSPDPPNDTTPQAASRRPITHLAVAALRAHLAEPMEAVHGCRSCLGCCPMKTQLSPPAVGAHTAPRQPGMTALGSPPRRRMAGNHLSPPQALSVLCASAR